MLYKTEGIVLRSSEFQDADKIVTILSKNNGKIMAIAKGVRKTKSKFGSSIENLTCANFLMYKGRNLDIINQSQIIDSFFRTSRDLNKYALAINAAEVINKLTIEREVNVSLYMLFKQLLIHLKTAKDPMLLALSYKWKVLHNIGYKPSLSHCYICGKKNEGSKALFFRIADGGVTCNQCAIRDKSEYLKITEYFTRLLRRIFITPLSLISKASIPIERIKELENLTNIYLNYYSDNIFKSERFLKNIQLSQDHQYDN